MSLTRAHEVGVRKVVGAGRGQLMRQYFAESMLLCFAALALAVLLTEILLPGLNSLRTVGSFESRLDLQYTPWTVMALAGFGVVMGLVAGRVPGTGAVADAAGRDYAGQAPSARPCQAAS